MPHFTRVRDKSNGYEFDLPVGAVDPEVHEPVNDPDEWPDLTGPRARPRPASTGAPAPKRTPRKSTRRKRTTSKAGQPATTSKES